MEDIRRRKKKNDGLKTLRIRKIYLTIKIVADRKRRKRRKRKKKRREGRKIGKIAIWNPKVIIAKLINNRRIDD